MTIIRMESNIVLCCVNPTDSGAAITNELLADFFSVYGEVVEVLIFSRKVLVKAFVEFASADVAQRALQAPVVGPPSLGRIKLYKSHKRSILRKGAKPETAGPEDDGTNNSVTSLDAPVPAPNAFSNYISSMKSFEEGGFRPETALNYPKARNFTLQDFSKLDAPREPPGRFSPFSVNDFEEGRARPQGSRATDEPRVLMANRVNFKFVNCALLNNLFGCFGNVTKVLLNREDSYALVEFENGAQACSAAAALRDRAFFGNPLKLKLSKYTSLNFKSLEREDSERKLDYLYANQKLFRFATGFGGIKIPPTPLLEVEGLGPEISPLALFELAGQVHEPERICQLARDVGEGRAFLLEFAAESQAMEVLAVLNGKVINGRVVIASFGRARAPSN